MEHAFRRAGGTYHYRRRVPLDLVASYGKREVTFSLHTKDRNVAQSEARKVSVRLDDEWSVRRSQTARIAAEPKPWPAEYDFVEVAGKAYAVPPARDHRPKAETTAVSDDEWQRAQDEHEQAFEEERRLHPDRWHEDAPSELEMLSPEVRALVEIGRAKQVIVASPPVMPPRLHGSATNAAQAMRTTLDTLVGHWKRERSVNSKTIAKMDRAVLEFNLFHKDPAVESITRAMVMAYRSSLLKRTKADGERALSKGTIDDRLSSIGTLLQLAFDHGIVPQNVATRTALPADKLAAKARIGYSRQQAEVVMAGTEQFRDTHPARYWLPRLARWTGARLNELHQLRRQDLIERDGIKGINIIDEGEHADGIAMRMKNAASRRWVPLHSAVVNFWTWAQDQPSGPLFPAKPDKHGIVSSEFSKWYGRTLRSKWGIADDRITFHSWRHAFADACRFANVQDSHRYALMGHSEGGAAGGYGSGALPPNVLLEALCRIGVANREG